MSKFEQYNIPLKGVEEDEVLFEFTLDDAYFKKIDSPEVQKGNLTATVKRKKKAMSFELDFSLDGFVTIPCSRCLDEMQQAIRYTDKLMVKLGDGFSEEDEVVIVPESEGKINIAWFLYEFVVLNIPIKHVHPAGECNKTMASKLKRHTTRLVEDDDVDEDDEDIEAVASEKETGDIDPRWEGLRDISDNNNN